MPGENTAIETLSKSTLYNDNLFYISVSKTGFGKCKRMPEVFLNSCKTALNNIIASDTVADRIHTQHSLKPSSTSSNTTAVMTTVHHGAHMIR